MTSEATFQSHVAKGLFAGLAMPPVVVTLPWPDKALSSNSRVHWSVRAKAVKQARTDAFYLTRAAATIKPNWKAVALSVTFNPPSRRRFDRDGLIGRMKAPQDGIADALGIDDYHFVPTYAFGEPVKGGSVRVEIRPI